MRAVLHHMLIHGFPKFNAILEALVSGWVVVGRFGGAGGWEVRH